MKFLPKNIMNLAILKNTLFLRRPYWFFFSKKYFFCFIPIKISHKLCIKMDGTQFLWLLCFTAKNHSRSVMLYLGSYIEILHKISKKKVTNLVPHYWNGPTLWEEVKVQSTIYGGNTKTLHVLLIYWKEEAKIFPLPLGHSVQGSSVVL